MEPRPIVRRPAIMRLHLLPAIAALCSAAAFAQPPQPDAVELFLRSARAEKANSEKANQYAYREYRVTREIDKNGKESNRQTETWDVIGLEGSTYRKLILRNDQPLDAKEQKREDQRLAEETARRKGQKRRKGLFSFTFNYGVQSLPPERTVALFDLQFKGEEEVDGRAAYVVEATPKANAHPANANEKENLNYRLKMWIDREDQVRSRGESEVIGEHSRMQKGSVIEAINARNEAGVWLPKETGFRFNLKILKMGNVRGDLRLTFSDYMKFQVDSQVVGQPAP
ncbi:MAG: hypothetical protein ACRD4E_05770 [Bryobacteraceae bacterium]